MKTYLNKEERNKYCVMALAAGEIGEILKKWQNNLTNDEHRSLKMAQTYIFKWMDSIKARVDQDFIQQLLRDCKCSEILVLPKFEAIRETQKRKLEDKYVQVEKETILDLADNALVGCHNCTKKDFKECNLRQVFMTLEVEAYDPTADGYCQYCIIKGQ